MKMKSFLWPVFTGISLIILTTGCFRQQPENNITTVSELTNLFPDPPADYRSAPLWDWNEKITEEGIDFQMREFKKGGIGGVFVHPRPGLLTEYLSDEWFHLFDYAVKKGKDLGMKVWIYDENSYPSGFAGGHVPAQMPDAYIHGAGLSLEIRDSLMVVPSDTVAVVLKKTEQGFLDITDKPERENGQKGAYYVYRKTYPGQSPWYGGYTYVDLLYPGVTEKFLELTMTKGYERNTADFGTGVPGIFTDEPNLEAAMPGGTLLRWTPDLWDVFQKRWGYDLKVNLPSLSERTGDWKKVRHDYYSLLLELFLDRWAKPWNRYCTEKKLAWTGHYWEHGWPEPTHGFDEAAFYIWHQMPGVDMLGNRLDSAGMGGQFGNERAVRELLSAANQAGWKRTLSETYGGGGYEMKFETQKRLVDWEMVMGVNFVNQHLSFYSMNGVRKFDYPPTFSYHEPWWENYRLMGDYIGRVCLALSSGNQVNKILLLQPNTTAWMYYARKAKNPETDSLKTGFKNFVYRLEQLQVEYDLGSENVLKTLGSAGNAILHVGKRDYSLVIIPAGMENIDMTTLDLLQQYLENGGKILSFCRDIPRIDGRESPKANELAARFSAQWIRAENLTDPAVRQLLQQEDFSMAGITGNGGLYHQRRILDDGQLLFVVNSHTSSPSLAEVSMKGKSVVMMDPVEGKIYSHPARSENGRVTFRIDLGPVGSALFLISEKEIKAPVFFPDRGEETRLSPAGEISVKRCSDNILVVDYLDLKTKRTDLKEVHFMVAIDTLFKGNGVRIGNPWQHKIQYKKNYLDLDTLFKDDSGFEVNYHFNIAQSLTAEKMKTIRVVVERPDLWQVSINGQAVTKSEGSWWIDKGFPQFAIGEYLKPGENTLTLIAPRMTILSEVMPVYLLGDFLVKPAQKGFEISGGEFSVLGSWRDAGLPFYSQKVAYSQQFVIEKKTDPTFKIRLGNWSGIVSEVTVNGNPAGLIAWPPYERDISEWLQEGPNEITVTVTGSLKNTFGFFYARNDGWIFGPGAWNKAPDKIPAPAGYYLVDYGLSEPFHLVAVKR